MTSKRPSPVLRYVIAVASIAAAVIITLLIRQVFTLNPTPLVLIGVIFAAWIGGLYPGLFSVILADLAIDFFFEDPLYEFTFAPIHFVRLLILGVIAVLASSRKNAEMKLATREQQQAAVARFGQEALSSIPTEQLLPRAADLVRETLGVDFCAVSEKVGNVELLRYTAGSGWVEDMIGFEFAYGGGASLAGEVLATGLPLAIRDLQRDGRFQYSDVLRRHKVRGAVGVPVLHRGEAYAVLGAFTVKPYEFTVDDINFLQTVANIVAQATARLQSEAAISEHRSWLKTTLSSIGDGVIATDAEGNVSLMNPVAEKMTGWNEADAHGVPLAEVFCIINEVTRQPLENPVNKVFDTGSVVGLANHTILISKDGSEIPISDSAAPISDAGDIKGVVLVFSDVSERKQAERSQRETEIMQRLVEAQESERHRIARDLHDHLGQKMTALRLKIESIANDFDGMPELKTAIAEARRSASQIDRDIGFLSWELRPTELADLGLSNALGSFVREWSEQYGVSAEFHTNMAAEVSASERLPEVLETNIYRILQEALHNIVKHADAQHVSVLLQDRKDHLVLIVEDDGRGFDTVERSQNGLAPGGLGLIGMRERAALLNGTLEVESQAGSGTTLLAKIPSERQPRNEPLAEAVV